MVSYHLITIYMYFMLFNTLNWNLNIMMYEIMKLFILVKFYYWLELKGYLFIMKNSLICDLCELIYQRD